MRQICAKLPYLEKRFSLLNKLRHFENLLTTTNDEVEEREEEEEESGSLAVAKSLRMLGNLHLFEAEQRQTWKRNEETEQTEKRKKLLSIS
jgi:hypothetical protein